MHVVDRAAQFFQHNGRDIDRARFGYHFGADSQADLLTVLRRYQNDDGGFGQNLEVDIKAPDSNPFATELALLACLQADVPRDHPLLQQTVEFLEATQDQDGGWRFSPGVYEYQLAPWFAGWTWPALNPSCTLAGLLAELQLGSETLHRRVEVLFQQLARVDDVAGDEFYAVRPYAYYFTAERPHPQRDLYRGGVVWWLLRQHIADKLVDNDHFFAYARHPQTFTAQQIPPSIINERLDRLMAEQADDGGWPSPYDQNWRGWVTVQNLLVLRAFGRI